MESAAEPPTSPPESASGVESATGLVRGGHSTGPPRRTLKSAWSPLESARSPPESARIVLSPFGIHFGGAPPDSARSPLRDGLLGRAQPVIPPNLYSADVNEHNSLGSPGNATDSALATSK